MKSLAMKFIVIILAAVFLLTGIASVLGMIVVAELEMTEQTPDEIYAQELRRKALNVAYSKVRAYQTFAYSTAPEEVIHYGITTLGMVDAYEYNLGPYMEAVGWVIIDQNGTGVSEGSMAAGENRELFRFEAISPTYDQVHPVSQIDLATPAILDRFSYGGVEYGVLSCTGNLYSVDIMLEVSDVPNGWDVLFFVYAIGDMLPFVLIGSLLLFGAAMVYLCWAAGKKKGTAEIRPAGLNVLPLDLYTVVVGFAGVLGVYLIFYLIGVQENNGFSWMMVWLTVALALLVCLLPVIYIFAIAAQVKAKGFWWRRSMIGWCLLKIFHAIRWCWRGLRALLRLLPVIWQWLLTAFGMALAVLICFLGAISYHYPQNQFSAIALFFAIAGCVAIVLYGGYCFGTILKAAKEMARGNLDHKVNNKYLIGAFRDCGENLNALSDAAMVAAREQMKSERMKTELITNVSHDIKTPLTSIINYVDLLQKPHSEEEGEQYLEVLSRQSQRLKKLTEDLVEMSKATTGNVPVELSELDVVETVLQALGEFGDKLDSVPLSIVFRQPEEPVLIRADGRLTWRVMSNLLSNAVKYAQPGTRLYADISQAGDRVTVAFKNISRESLNLSAEELMERFVRGDASRNTEGSGLGLNIAQSLMQVQHGELALHIDGDLFKVTLTFPRA